MLGYLLRCILRALVWRGISTLTRSRKPRGKYSDRNDWE